MDALQHVYTGLRPELREFLQNKTRRHFFRLTWRTTVCILTTENGFEVLGEAHVSDPEKYDRETGEEIALRDAIRKLDEHLAFLQREGGSKDEPV